MLQAASDFKQVLAFSVTSGKDAFQVILATAGPQVLGLLTAKARQSMSACWKMTPHAPIQILIAKLFARAGVHLVYPKTNLMLGLPEGALSCPFCH